MEKKLNEMFYLQDKLNNNTNGINWKEGISKNNRKINWNRALHMEITEFIDSFPWKHWKDIEAKADYNNAKIELVDGWHFIMSELIKLEFLDHEEIIKIIDTSYKRCYQTDDIEKIIKSAEKLCALSLVILEDYLLLVNSFFDLCSYFGLPFDDLYRLYIGKNVLNEFRQDNGYKHGEYIKIWNKKEDNIVMQEILNSKSLNYDELYTELSNIYEGVKNA